MRRFIGNKYAAAAVAFAAVMAGWWLLSRVYPPLVVPPIRAVADRLAGIVASPGAWRIVGVTAVRLAAGLAIGIGAGTTAGALLGRYAALHAVFRPLVGLVQAVPPVSWLVLALIWFGFDGRASVFIVAVGTAPVLVANIVEGVRGLDVGLLQMAYLYRLSRWKRFRHIVAPSLLPSFRAGVLVAIGLGAKTVIMGEVLTTTTGIGGQITDARLNLEPESVVAWTVVIVALYYFVNGLASVLLRGRRGAPC